MIQPIYFENSYNNFAYLLSCPITHQAFVVDPFRADEIELELEKQGLHLAGIINTHSHWDHVGGNMTLQNHFSCDIFAHPDAKSPGQTHSLQDGKTIPIGKTGDIVIHHTPGHTSDSLCIIYNKTHLISGDTLFHSGCGNCKNGGDVHQLFASFSRVLSKLDAHLILCPGHDYQQTNKAFTTHFKKTHEIDLEPETKQNSPATLGTERRANLFLNFSEPGNPLYSKTKFLTARKERNHW